MPNFTLKFTDKLKRGRDRARSGSNSCGASQGLARRDTHTDAVSSADASTSTSTSTSTSAGTSTSSANARPSLPCADPDPPKRAGRLKIRFNAFFNSRKKEAIKTPTTTIPTTTATPATTTAAPDARHQGHAHDHHRINTDLVHTPSSSDRSVASRHRSLRRQPQLCTEELEALESLHEALHHRSVLDATRHQRYGLSPQMVFEPRPVPVMRPILGCLPPSLVSISARALSRVGDAHNESQASLSLAPASLAKRHNTQSVVSSRLGPRDASTAFFPRIERIHSTTNTHNSSNSASETRRERHVQRGACAATRRESTVHRMTSQVNTIPFPRMQSRRGRGTSTALDVTANAPLSSSTTASSSVRSTRYTTVRRQTASWENLTPPIPTDEDGSAVRVPAAQDMRILRFLAEGTSGKVYHVEDRVTRARIALKVISKADKSDFLMGVLLAERDILEKLADCPYFVKLYCSWHDHDNLYMAMTVYPTDLDSELIKHEKLHPERARFYMAELIIALTELHSRGIIHRDVKAPNILIDRTGHIVLADFGLSKDFGKRPSMPERVFQPFWPYMPEDRPTSNTPQRTAEEMYFVSWDYRGSELEMAPEIHLRQPYSFGVDFWSAAVVLYWMLTGRPPWYEEEDDDEDEEERDTTPGSSSSLSRHYHKKPVSLKVIEDDLYWDDEDDIDDVTKDFLEKMLCKNPASRLIISYQMPHHPYFDDIDWPAMEARSVATPWIPDHEVCHAYEPSSPTFVAGTPYATHECDPNPLFTYVSEDATPRAGVVPCTSSTGSDDSDRYDAAELVTVVVRRRTAYGDDGIVERGEQTLVGMDAVDDASVDASVEEQEAEQQEEAADEEELQHGWDRTMVSPAPTSPLGPGPKQWLQAQDLQKIQSTPNSPHSSLSPLPHRLPSPLSPSPSPSPSPSASASLSQSPSLSSPLSPIASDSDLVEVMYVRRTSSSDGLADSSAPPHTPSRSGSQTPPPSSSSSPSSLPSASRRLGAFAKFKVLISKLRKRSGKKQQ